MCGRWPEKDKAEFRETVISMWVTRCCLLARPSISQLRRVYGFRRHSISGGRQLTKCGCDPCDRVLATDMSRHFDIVGAFSSKFVKEHVSSHGYITKDTSFRHGQRMSTDDQACRSNTVKRFKSLDQTTQILSLQVALKVGVVCLGLGAA